MIRDVLSGIFGLGSDPMYQLHVQQQAAARSQQDALMHLQTAYTQMRSVDQYNHVPAGIAWKVWLASNRVYAELRRCFPSQDTPTAEYIFGKRMERLLQRRSDGV